MGLEAIGPKPNTSKPAHLVVEKKLKLNQGGIGHENQALQHGTDHRDPERSRGRHAGQGALPQVRRQRCDDIQLEIEVCRHERQRGTASQGA